MHLAVLPDGSDFRSGLVLGVLAVVVVLAGVALVLLTERPRNRRRNLVPAAGIAMVIASVVALDRTGSGALLRGQLITGLALLIIGPFLAALVADRIPKPRAAPSLVALAAVPGALIVARAASIDNDTAWVPPLVFGAVVIGGALLCDFDGANQRSGLAPVLLAITVGGMYITLPDTELIVVVMGVTFALALLGVPFPVAAYGSGAYCVAGLLGWLAAVDGRGRPGSVVGAIACLGVLVVEPLVRRIVGSRARGLKLPRPRSRRALLVVLLQIVVVVIAARVAGLQESGAAAAVLATIALVVAAAGLAVLLSPAGRGTPRAGGATRSQRRAPGPPGS